MEYWSSCPINNGDSSSNFINPFSNIHHLSSTYASLAIGNQDNKDLPSGTMVMEEQQGLLHKHHVPPPMMESNSINGYEKKKMTSEQLKLLERCFQEEVRLDQDRKMKLSKELGLQPRQIAVWFQNKKARWKNKQLEYRYKSLRQEFDLVSREKKLLEEELIQLKSMIKENGSSKKKQT